ncbi:hypothetical protein Tco_1464243, partial [Tanacetum coccineum]
TLELSLGTFLNGHVHWVVDEDSPDDKLCDFDVDNETFHFDFTIWVMKEYGIKESWHKEVVIKQSISWDSERYIGGPVHLMESLEDGTVLMLLDWWGLLVYCPQNKTIKKREFSERYLTGMAYRPSFLKLQAFESESVHVL